MKSLPRPRTEVFSAYWTLAAERHRAFQRRVSGLPAPWTDDPILRRYKFCNTFRAADRVSQYMIRTVCYGDSKASLADVVFRIVAFRMFSKPNTWNRLTARLGHAPTIDDLQTGDFRRALTEVHAEGNGLYTGAFILCANRAYGHSEKHGNHAALFYDMFVNSEAADRIVAASSLEEVYETLHEFPLMGDFMSYQTAIDINYSEATNFSENDFTKPGPGAVRGLRKVFTTLGDFTPEEAIQWMVERQDDEFDRLGLEFAGLWGRPLHAIDCQGLFCETDKYSRVAFPQLASNRTRIKAEFHPNATPIRLYFPPKWGINGRIPRGKVLGGTAMCHQSDAVQAA